MPSTPWRYGTEVRRMQFREIVALLTVLQVAAGIKVVDDDTRYSTEKSWLSNPTFNPVLRRARQDPKRSTPSSSHPPTPPPTFEPPPPSSLIDFDGEGKVDDTASVWERRSAWTASG